MPQTSTIIPLDAMSVDVERTFNHDLLVCEQDRDRAANRRPLIATVLIDRELIHELKPHDIPG